MNTYELCVLFRIMPKTELAATVKRTAMGIFDRGGILRKLEHLGTREMPYKTSSHGLPHRAASYFVFEFNMPLPKLDILLDECNRDIDIIRRRLYKKNEPETFECTLHDELQPPPYRKGVQELIKEARSLDKPKFEYNTGLDYYPFQK